MASQFPQWQLVQGAEEPRWCLLVFHSMFVQQPDMCGCVGKKDSINQKVLIWTPLFSWARHAEDESGPDHLARMADGESPPICSDGYPESTSSAWSNASHAADATTSSTSTSISSTWCFLSFSLPWATPWTHRQRATLQCTRGLCSRRAELCYTVAGAEAAPGEADRGLGAGGSDRDHHWG